LLVDYLFNLVDYLLILYLLDLILLDLLY